MPSLEVLFSPQQQGPVLASSCVSDRKEFLPTFLGVVMEMESGLD